MIYDAKLHKMVAVKLEETKRKLLIISYKGYIKKLITFLTKEKAKSLGHLELQGGLPCKYWLDSTSGI